MGIQTSLDAVLGAERVVDALRCADELAFQASRDGGPRTIRVLTRALAGADQLAAIAATHALGQITDDAADVVLSGLLSADRAFLVEHAAWVLGGRRPRPDALSRLIGMVSGGGFTWMIAQRTLEHWSAPASELLSVALQAALLGTWETEARRRLVETIGLVPGRLSTGALLDIAGRRHEAEPVRVAAVSALGQRRGESEIVALVTGLADHEGQLGDVARLAMVDLRAGGAGGTGPGGLTVAQLFLHADVDADLTQAGSGDNGGIATLLVRLGDALVEAESGDTARVITMSRGSVAGALESVREIGARTQGHLFGRVPLLGPPVQAGDAWPLRVAARRGVRRLLRAAGGVDLMHLRMADVGTLAAFDVARERDVPVVFTVAPDPHAVIHSMDLAGRLTHDDFGDVDESEHFWFRTRLVQRLAGNAAHTVMFPRPDLARDMRELVGIDISTHPERHSIVAEGIDLQVLDRAAAEVADSIRTGTPSPALAELRGLLETLPPGRRGLPLVVSVGRFHRVKGMATIVEAWTRSPLAERANLLLVGGDLDSPSPDEQEQLTRIDALVPHAERSRHGLVLPGHRSNSTVARWLAAARTGVPGLSAARGLYVCGSLKEEFGIALLEAMAAGLVVVAPDGGGPATYVEQGVTGYLTRTWDVEQLARAMTRALDAAQAETDGRRAARSRETVARSFTIQTMARSLDATYRRVTDEHDALTDYLVAAG